MTIEELAKKVEVLDEQLAETWRHFQMGAFSPAKIRAVLCPVCQGVGQVGAGFYTNGVAGSSTANVYCRSCFGAGYLNLEGTSPTDTALGQKEEPARGTPDGTTEATRPADR